MELMHASKQWATRPNDERFTSLTELYGKVYAQRDASRQTVVSTRRIEVQPHEVDPIRGIQVVGPNGHPTTPTNWSFNQLAQLAGAPASYLRKLPAPIVADAMNYGLRFDRDVAEIGCLLTKEDMASEPPHISLRAATGPNYGRIWNDEIVRSLMDKFGDGVTGDFKVPGEFGRDVPVTKANTTIYGSDRDIFIFLADEKNRIEMSDRRDGRSGSLARGFFVWNSEVGSQSIGAAFFLFDYTCSNRIVWGAQEFKEIRLRHTSGAPDRWLEEITPVISAYSEASAAPVERMIKEAQNKRLGDDLDKFLANRFTKAEATSIKAAHEREEGRPIESLWDVATGITAHAKTIGFQDARVAMERQAGKVLDLVAA